MRHFFIKALAGSGLLLFSLTANAQYPPRDYRYQDRDDRHRGAWLFDRLRADLDRADASTLPFVGDFNGDRFRISRAREEVNDFQRAWSLGSDDRRELNQAIRAVRTVLDENHLPSQLRYRLTNDLNRLRDFRATYNNW